MDENGSALVTPPQYAAALAALGSACQSLAIMDSVSDVKDLRDRAAAFRLYLARCRAGQEAQNAAAEVKIRCERRMGELIGELIPNGRVKAAEEQHRVVLKDFGLSGTESTRLQRVASVPEGEFEAYIQTVRGEGLELTTAGVLRLWKVLNQDAGGADAVDRSGTPAYVGPPPGLTRSADGSVTGFAAKVPALKSVQFRRVSAGMAATVLEMADGSYAAVSLRAVDGRLELEEMGSP